MSTQQTPLRILHLEDNDNDAEIVRRRLAETMEVELTRVFKRESYLTALEDGRFDLILSDYTIPGFDGGSALALAKERCPDVPFVFVSGTLGEHAAIESLKHGATDYVLKHRLERLVPAVKGAVLERAEREGLRQAEQEVRQRAELFQVISDNVTDLVSVVDLDGKRLYTSSSYETLFGAQSLHGTDAFADIHPEDRAHVKQLFGDVIKTGVGKPAEFRFLLKTGKIHYIESHSGVIRNKQGDVTNVIIVSRDVTKRKLAERSLKESEERFRSVLQTAEDAIILADGSGKILTWNAAAQRIFGYTEQEARGIPVGSLLAQCYRERYHPGFGITAGASRFVAVAIEVRGRRKDCTEFPLEVSISSWKTGGETYYSAILRDVTERQRTRETLERLQRQNELLLHAAGEGICGLNRDGRITFANPAAARILKYNVDDLVGRSFEEVSEAGGQGSVANSRPFRATLTDGTTHRKSHEIFWRKDGKSVPVEYITTPIWERGELSGAVLVFKDITERQQAQEQLQEQAALLDNATDAICVIDMDARVVYWNKSAERLYGWTAAEAVGRIAPDLLFKNDSQQATEAFKTLLEKHVWHGELHQTSKTGHKLFVYSRWTLMRDSKGGSKSILIINSDITERKAIEAQLLRAQRLESVGRLAAGIAHDLNNILAPILMTSGLLAPKLKDDSDRKILEMINVSAQRGAEMVKQILFFSRGADAGKGRVQFRDLIDEQVKIARQTFPPAINIRTRMATDLWAVQGNGTQLFQVLMNLCVNARDAMANGGTLLLEAENVVLDSEHAQMHAGAKAGRHILVTVSDTGTGIPPEMLEKLYRPFVSSKPSGKGTGLGLFTASSIVRNHQGHLQVKSDPGKGTTFKIFLPAASEKDQNTAPSRPQKMSAPRGNGEWILVVENEQTIREITTVTLEHAGYRVLPASDGTEAIARYAKFQDRIALVISDLVMPFLDGAGTIRALRRMNPGVKVLAVSGKVEAKSLLPDIDVSFLAKPFSSERLLVQIHRILTEPKRGTNFQQGNGTNSSNGK